jgi:hypothetical protein
LQSVEVRGQVEVGDVLRGEVAVRSSLNWPQVIGEMREPPVETLTERSIRHVMDLHGLVQLANRIQASVLETSSVVRGEGMEEDLMEGQSSASLQETSSSGEEEEMVDALEGPGFFD